MSLARQISAQVRTSFLENAVTGRSFTAVSAEPRAMLLQGAFGRFVKMRPRARSRKSAELARRSGKASVIRSALFAKKAGDTQ
jgi:hypothetical protein